MQGDITEPLFIEVRDIDHDTQLVTGGHKAQPILRKTDADVAGGRIPERHSLSEDCRSAPDRTEGPQASAMKYVQRVKITVDRFGTLHVQHGSDYTFFHALPNRSNITANPERTGILKREQYCYLPQRDRQGSSLFDCRRQRDIESRFAHRLKNRINISRTWDVDGEESAAKPTAFCPLKIYRALAPADKGVNAVFVTATLQSQQHIVVPVKNRRMRCHGRGLVVGHIGS